MAVSLVWASILGAIWTA